MLPGMEVKLHMIMRLVSNHQVLPVHCFLEGLGSLLSLKVLMLPSSSERLLQWSDILAWSPPSSLVSVLATVTPRHQGRA